jgi:glucose/arabinose dehydrogenase
MAVARSRSIFNLLGVAIVVAALIVPATARNAAAAPHREPAAPGEVDGQVQDAQGKPMSGVAVTMLKAGEEKPKSMVSGADGAFKFDELPSGVYIAAAAMEGYAPVTCRGIRLVAGQSRRLEIKLMPAGGEPSTCNPVEPAEPGT